MFLLTMLSIVSFTGCDKTDEPNGPGTDYDNLFDKTYTINNDGCCVLGCSVRCSEKQMLKSPVKLLI